MSKSKSKSSSRPHVVDGGLPADLEEMRTRVFVNPQAPSHTSSILSADTFASQGLDNEFRLDLFKRDFRIDVQHIERRGETVVDPITGAEVVADSDRIVFDMVGIEAPLANAFRRILLAEVPTMAIERVLLFQNTSIIQDEVLAHRLGLIPIAADPRQFQYVRESAREKRDRNKPRNPKANDDKSITISQHPAGQPNELNTLVFVLDVKCTRKIDPKTGKPAGEEKADMDKYENYLVHSRQLQWIPQGSQAKRFSAPGAAPKPYYDDIVLAKLRPGQSIEAELHVEKGIGQQHAKWSPVATASYRLLPEVLFTTPVENELADELKAKCPMNVFDIEDLGSKRVAKAARPRNCTMCRECTRGDAGEVNGEAATWSDRVKLRRVRDHFVFSVETTGAYSPTQVVREALAVLKEKSHTLKRLFKGEQGQADEEEESANGAAATESKMKEEDEDDEEEEEESSAAEEEDEE